jgi:hypothetical protein
MPGHVTHGKPRSVACRREADALDLALEPSALLFMGRRKRERRLRRKR